MGFPADANSRSHLCWRALIAFTHDPSCTSWYRTYIVQALSYMDEDFMYQLEGRYLDNAEAIKLRIHLNMAAAQLLLGDYNTAIYNCGQVGAVGGQGFSCEGAGEKGLGGLGDERKSGGGDGATVLEARRHRAL